MTPLNELLPKSLHIVFPVYNPTDVQGVFVIIWSLKKICEKPRLPSMLNFSHEQYMYVIVY